MKEETLMIIALIFGVVLGGVGIGMMVQEGNRISAIEHGCGQYSPKSGDFEWLKINK